MPSYTEETCKDYSKFMMIDMHERLNPVNKLIDDMHARLEEFQTMIYFAQQERVNAVNLLASVCSNQQNFTDLFQRIDSVENLIEHVKGTLNALEKDIEKAEEEVGLSDSTANKVTNIFTPLFKKNPERSQASSSSQIYKTSDYFYPS